MSFESVRSLGVEERFYLDGRTAGRPSEWDLLQGLERSIKQDIRNANLSAEYYATRAAQLENTSTESAPEISNEQVA